MKEIADFLFKPGDKVRCINLPHDPHNYLKIGAIYTVRKLYSIGSGHICFEEGPKGPEYLGTHDDNWFYSTDYYGMPTFVKVSVDLNNITGETFAYLARE